VIEYETRRFFRPTLWRWLHSERLWWFQWKKRSELPTHLYVGLPGSGKSMLMVQDAIVAMRDGVQVCSNLTIRDRLTGTESEPIASWLDVARWAVWAIENQRPVLFAIDEIHLWCDARNFANTPLWLLNLFAQKRHYGIGICGTTQALGQVEKRLRTLIDEIVVPSPSIFGKLRMPVFWAARVLPNVLLGEGGTDDYALSNRSLRWVRWWGRHGYATAELIATDDLTLYKQAEVAAEIEALTNRAVAAAQCHALPAFWDYLSAGARTADPDNALAAEAAPAASDASGAGVPARGTADAVHTSPMFGSGSAVSPGCVAKPGGTVALPENG